MHCFSLANELMVRIVIFKSYLGNIATSLQVKLSVWKIVLFVAPLMFILFIQRVSRPLINLIVARKSPSKDIAAQV